MVSPRPCNMLAAALTTLTAFEANRRGKSDTVSEGKSREKASSEFPPLNGGPSVSLTRAGSHSHLDSTAKKGREVKDSDWLRAGSGH